MGTNMRTTSGTTWELHVNKIRCIADIDDAKAVFEVGADCVKKISPPTKLPPKTNIMQGTIAPLQNTHTNTKSNLSKWIKKN
jgi:hypothetical protein